jgi:hypothetical protein
MSLKSQGDIKKHLSNKFDRLRPYFEGLDESELKQLDIVDLMQGCASADLGTMIEFYTQYQYLFMPREGVTTTGDSVAPAFRFVSMPEPPRPPSFVLADGVLDIRETMKNCKLCKNCR